MRSHRHAFNIGLNVGGMVLPMLVGVLTVPGLLQRLGQEKFGVLALGWALVGYFGFLDLGMGRALTQYLASADQAGVSRQEQATVACAARRLLGGLSLGMALLLWLLLPTPRSSTLICLRPLRTRFWKSCAPPAATLWMWTTRLPGRKLALRSSRTTPLIRLSCTRSCWT